MFKLLETKFKGIEIDNILYVKEVLKNELFVYQEDIFNVLFNIIIDETEIKEIDSIYKEVLQKINNQSNYTINVNFIDIGNFTIFISPDLYFIGNNKYKRNYNYSELSLFIQTIKQFFDQGNI